MIHKENSKTHINVYTQVFNLIVYEQTKFFTKTCLALRLLIA